eukprot:820159-Pyramimonas_sp.AAC.2
MARRASGSANPCLAASDSESLEECSPTSTENQKSKVARETGHPIGNNSRLYFRGAADRLACDASRAKGERSGR